MFEGSITWLPELIKLVGFSAVMFAVWIITLRYLNAKDKESRTERSERDSRESKERLEQAAKTQAEQKEREERTAEQYRVMLQMVLDHHAEQNRLREHEHKEDFEVLNKFATTIDSHTTQLAILVGAITNNQWCPAVRNASHHP